MDILHNLVEESFQHKAPTKPFVLNANPELIRNWHRRSLGRRRESNGERHAPTELMVTREMPRALGQGHSSFGRVLGLDN
jgi:hypothetical protein